MLPKTVFSRGKFESLHFTSIGCFRRLFLVMGGLYHRILSATGSKAEGLVSHARRKRVGGFLFFSILIFLFLLYVCLSLYIFIGGGFVFVVLSDGLVAPL